MRAASLRRLGDERFDVLVVGGGITGAGVALDAASRGLRTALVERDDFASGTSSKSSKLVHGGLRYLQQREFRLVYEALYERQRALENAPHLVRVLPFLVPCYARRGDRPTARPAARQRALDVRPHRRSAHRQAPPPHRRRRRARAHADARPRPARGRVRVLRRAGRRRPPHAHHRPHRGRARRGRSPTTRAVRGIVEGRRPRRRRAASRPTATSSIVRARGRRERGRRVGRRRARARRGHAPGVDPSGQGHPHHVPWAKVRNDIAAIVPVPRRPALGVRRARGVTPPTSAPPTPTTTARSTTRRARPPTSTTCSPRINGVTDEQLTEADVVGHVGRPAARSCARATVDPHRRPVAPAHGAHVSPSGVVTVTGGKLTTYRRMAADAVDAAARGRSVSAAARRARSTSACSAARASHRRSPRSSRARTSTSPAATAPRPRRCSPSSPTIPTSASRSCPACRTCAPRRVYAVRHEMARTLDDVLVAPHAGAAAGARRVGDAADDVAELLASDLGWSEAERDAQVAGYRAVDRHRTRAAVVSASRDARARDPGDAVSGASGSAGSKRPRGVSPLHGTVAEVPAAVLDRLAALARWTTAPDAVAAASRDWWPLAMIWERRRHRRSPRPPRWSTPTDRRRRSRRCCASVRRRAGAPHRRRRPQRRVRREHAGARRRGARPHRAHRHRRRRRHVARARRAGRHVRHAARRPALRAEHGVTLGPLAPVDRPLDRRRVARVPERGPAVHPLREDRGHGAGARRRARRRPRPCTPAARRVPRSGPTSPSCSWAARARSGSSPAPACACTRRRPARCAPRTGSTRFVDGLDACRRILRRGATPAVLRLYDAIEGDRHFGTGDATMLLVLDEGDPALRRRRAAGRARGVRDATRRRRRAARHVARAPQRRLRARSTTSSRARSSTRWRSRRAGRRCPACTTRVLAALRRCRRPRGGVGAPLATRTSTAPASTSPSAASRRRTNVRTSTAAPGTRHGGDADRTARR